MSMHERLSKQALLRAFRQLPFSDEQKALIVEHLPREAIITPHPDYGQIVHDLPDGYQFEALRRKMDGERDQYIQFFRENLARYQNHQNLDSLPSDKPADGGFFWNNGFFEGDDARSLYGFVARFEPRVFLEVGVGYSTRIARMAIQDFGLRTTIRSIDPSPRAAIDRYSDQILNASITEVDPSSFKSLESNDILFIDGSHVCHVGTDVPYFFLEVFPLLARGVIVHIHDIQLPWEYSESFRVRHYNEQHMLGAMLANSEGWEILLPVHYMKRTEAVEGLSRGGGSFWFRKIG